MIQYTLSSTEEEVEQVLQLQQQNFPSNLSTEELVSDGFVTVQHSADILLKWQQEQPHVIAISNGKVVGYALTMLPKYKADIPILIPMFEKIDAHVDQSIRYLVMGQICIDKSFRGKGIFRGLYDKMKSSYTQFDWIITEVDTANKRSVNAHKAVGFQEFLRYEQEEQTWSLIYLNLREN